MALKPEAALRKDLTMPSGKDVFQHRHFAAMAAIIKQMDGEDFEGLRPTIARFFASELARTNPRFDRSRFLAACGVKP